jgi:hypothetical protein
MTAHGSARERNLLFALPFLLAAIGWACGGSEPQAPREEAASPEQPPVENAEKERPSEEVVPPPAIAAPPPTSVAPSPRQNNPLDIFVDKAAAYLASTQAANGSWPYFRSRTADFGETASDPDFLGTMTVLMNLTHTDLEASPMFERGADHLASRRHESGAWALDAGEAFAPFLPEPDADRTSLALTLLAGRFTVDGGKLEELRSLFAPHRASDGLYRTFFDGLRRDHGIVPFRNAPSIGVNLNVLGAFARYGLERAQLAASLARAIHRERYWEDRPFYRSPLFLAYLASNALEQGASEAGELLPRLLSDFAATAGQGEDFASKLSSVELAAYVKARSQLCLLERSPCRDLDMSVFELSKRRKQDGSWPTAAFQERDENPEAFAAFVAGRDYALPREGGGVRYDVDRALAPPGVVHDYFGSPAETTSFALKAMVLYRRLLKERPSFGSP